jgi:hypothetical protein
MSASTEDLTAALHAKLLALGGERVVAQPEDDLKALVARGRTFEDLAVTEPPAEALPYMRDSQCHANVATLYEARPRRIVICTGWALSADGLWRQHSWAIEKAYGSKIPQPRLIETTEPREIYFGIELATKQARIFASENV